jgi:regulator of replication initiation timing
MSIKDLFDNAQGAPLTSGEQLALESHTLQENQEFQKEIVRRHEQIEPVIRPGEDFAWFSALVKRYPFWDTARRNRVIGQATALITQYQLAPQVPDIQEELQRMVPQLQQLTLENRELAPQLDAALQQTESEIQELEANMSDAQRQGIDSGILIDRIIKIGGWTAAGLYNGYLWFIKK